MDPVTCKKLAHAAPIVDNTVIPSLDNSEADGEKIPDAPADEKDTEGVFMRLTLTLFSVLVSSSLLAAYNPTTFYASIVYVASGTIRPILIYGSWKGWIYECTNPDPIIKVIECCYMRRHEEDFVGEEEAYRLLQEIIRSPELFKALTGSCLLGATDPALDKLSERDKKKLEHLWKLEEKGFDVKELKEQMTGKLGIKEGEDFSHMD